MKQRLRHLLPAPTELTGGIFLTVVILLLANTKRLLNFYGLHSSDELIKSSAGNVLSQALKTIDSFSATNGVVTFLIWAVVGVLCFGIVEALGHAYQEIKLQKQVSSKNYVHPASFNSGKFWQGIVLEACTLAGGLILLGVTCLAFMVFVVPLGLAYSRVFLFGISAQNALYMLLGMVVVLFGLLVVDSAVRCLLYRRRIFGLS